MIFARRAVQKRLDELRGAIGDHAVDGLVARLNQLKPDSVAAEWEVACLHAFSGLGTLEVERPLPTGRRPDIFFETGDLEITADITAVSDAGILDENAYDELRHHVRIGVRKLGIITSAIDLRVEGQDRFERGGGRHFLRLPPRRRIAPFVRDRIVPELRSQLLTGATTLKLVINDAEAGLRLTVKPSDIPLGSGGYPVFDQPTSLTKNPLWGALRGKARQLRGASGSVGVIVGDAGYWPLGDHAPTMSEHHPGYIATEFLRQHTSIDFVLILAVRDMPIRSVFDHSSSPVVVPCLVSRRDRPLDSNLLDLLERMVTRLPTPVSRATNAHIRAKEPGFGLGFHGGYKMGPTKIKVSARQVLELLAGLPPRELSMSARGEERLQQAFLKHLQRGSLPTCVRVVRTDENENDDWIEFEFGDPDPAISIYR